MPATVDALKIHLGLDPASAVDAAAMQAACDAANDEAVTFRPDVTLDEAGDQLTTWPPRIDEGAILEAARFYGRRGSVAGVAAFADVGIAMLGRMDPDARRLWELGEYQRPVVA